jgi:hypothetical protein
VPKFGLTQDQGQEVLVSNINRRPLRFLGVGVLIGASALAFAACSSGGSGGAAAAATAPRALCQQLNGVLSDGPDPDVDPVGYALSQIEPLQTIHSSDSSAVHEVSQLISADQAFYNSNGSDKAAATAIKKADASLNKVCPGVAS